MDPNTYMKNPYYPAKQHTSSVKEETVPMLQNSVLHHTTEPNMQDDQLLIVTPEESDDDDALLLC